MTAKQYQQLDELLEIASTEKLSILFNKAFEFSMLIGNNELSKWIETELNGYKSNKYDDNSLIPDYRTILGYYTDENGIDLREHYYYNESYTKSFSFDSICEIENWANSEKSIDYHSIFNCESNNKNIKIVKFTYFSNQLNSVLQKIRNELIKRLIILKQEQSIMENSFTKVEIQKLTLNLHIEIQKVALKSIETENYRAAIMDTFIHLIALIKEKSNCQKDGVSLIEQVFSKNQPILKISDNLDEREGLMYLFKGAIMIFRNVPTHHLRQYENLIEAFQILDMANFLYQKLDECSLVTRE